METILNALGQITRNARKHSTKVP